MILLDTSVLSVAFRRRSTASAEPGPARTLRRMIEADVPLAIPGIVLQELLGGVPTEAQFSRLEALMCAFPLLVAERRHHVSAARIANACRRVGITASTVDCLIASLSIDTGAALFTLDADFSRMAPHCGLRIFRVREDGG
jgi:predicted nucleic acid-binding protein